MCTHCAPIVWIAFIVFLVGIAVKLTWMARLARTKRVGIPTFDANTGLRSLLHWVTPFGAHDMRLRPQFTVVSLAFLACLLLTPLFAMGHAVLWKQAWGVRWWSLPQLTGDLMTLSVIGGGVFFLVRGLSAPEVRRVTNLTDVLLLLLVVCPFVTAFVARTQWLRPWIPYEVLITLHIVSGALWLMAIPFARLARLLWFVFARPSLGSEFGAVRNARDG